MDSNEESPAGGSRPLYACWANCSPTRHGRCMAMNSYLRYPPSDSPGNNKCICDEPISSPTVAKLIICIPTSNPSAVRFDIRRCNHCSILRQALQKPCLRSRHTRVRIRPRPRNLLRQVYHLLSRLRRADGRIHHLRLRDGLCGSVTGAGGCLFDLLHERAAAAAEGGAAVVAAGSLDLVLVPHVAPVRHLVYALQAAEG